LSSSAIDPRDHRRVPLLIRCRAAALSRAGPRALRCILQRGHFSVKRPAAHRRRRSPEFPCNPHDRRSPSGGHRLASLAVVRIAVSDAGRVFGRQTRAYAEYRIFSRLARFGDIVRQADISLSALPTDSADVLCRVVVAVGDGRCLRVAARGRHVHEAINRAAQRIGDAVHRHLELALPS
jgi:hypothetical protein